MMWIRPANSDGAATTSSRQRTSARRHKVRVAGFLDGPHAVTNAQFAAFVKATGYLTTADASPTGNDQGASGSRDAEPADSTLVPGAMVFVGTQKPVPLMITRMVAIRSRRGLESTRKARQQHEGRTTIRRCRSLTRTRLAYAKVAGKRLPNRGLMESPPGGVRASAYAWGDEVPAKDAHFWDAQAQPFPVVSRKQAAPPATSPVETFRRTATPPRHDRQCVAVGRRL